MSKTASENHFNASARDWDQRPTSQQLAVVPARLLSLVPFGDNEHVLDFGAGTGLLATAIAPHVAHVTALDTSANMLAVLRDKGVANIETLQQDIFDGLPHTYDVVVSCMAMHHVADTAALLQAFAQALRPGGRMALIDLYEEDGSFHGSPETNAAKGVQHHGFAPAHLQRLAGRVGLSDIAFQEVASIQREHGRRYPLFLMTAQKTNHEARPA